MKGVDDYLDSYLDGQSDPGTAVMLVGHWGAGKTHYIRSYFERRASRQVAVVPDRRSAWLLKKLRALFPSSVSRDARVLNEASSPGFLYASFFSTDGSAGISDQFLSQLYPGVNSALGKVLGAAAMRLTGVATKLLSAGALSDLAREEDVHALKAWLANPKGRTLVFDDLERSSIPILERLSIINSYVERDGLKVIVLANEDELDLLDSYRRWKEKVVGKTIRVLSDANSVLDSLCSELSAGAVRDALQTRREEVLEVLSSLNSVNFRSVRSLVFDVQRIVSMLDPRLMEAEQAVLQLLKFSIAVGGELRSGRIQIEDVRALQQSLIIRVKDKEKRTDHEKFLLDLEERFSIVGALESVVPGQEMARYWQDGTLDVQESNAGVIAHPLVVGEERRPAWLRLWEVRRIKAVDLARAIADLNVSLRSHEIVLQGELLHLAGIGLTFETLGADLFPDFLDTESWLKSYINDPEVSDRLKRTVSENDGSDSFGGHGYHNREHPRFRAMYDELQLAVARADDKNLLSSVPELLKQVRERDYSNVYSFEGGGALARTPWLRLVDTCEMADILLDDGALRPKLSSSIIKRYDNDLGIYRPEWAWLQLLRREILRRAFSLPAPFKVIVIENVNEARRRIMFSIRQTMKWASHGG